MIIEYCIMCGKQFNTDDSNFSKFISCPHCKKMTPISYLPEEVPAAPPVKLSRPLTADPRVDERDAQGRTALMIAALNDEPEKVRRLIEKGADVNIADNEGYTALNYAYIDHSFKPAEILIDNGADLNIKDKYGRNILFQALAGINNSEYIDKMLIKKGADINTVNSEGTPLLHYALELVLNDRSNAAKVNMLLASGVNVNVYNSNGITALNAAIILGFCDIVPVMINFGAKVNLADKNEKQLTPVMTAAIAHSMDNFGAGRLLIIDELASRGAFLNALSGEKKSALDYAIEGGRQDMISLLISYGVLRADEMNMGLTMSSFQISNDDSNEAAPVAEKIALPNFDDAADANNFACKLEHDGKLDEALKIYQQLNIKFPNYKKAWRNRAMILARKKDYDAAFEFLKKAISIDPLYVMAHMGFGLIYDAMEKHDMAINRFDYILKIDPYNLDAMFNKGLTLYKAGRTDEAAAAFAEVVSKNPDDAEAAYWLEKLSVN